MEEIEAVEDEEVVDQHEGVVLIRSGWLTEKELHAEVWMQSTQYLALVEEGGYDRDAEPVKSLLLLLEEVRSGVEFTPIALLANERDVTWVIKDVVVSIGLQ